MKELYVIGICSDCGHTLSNLSNGSCTFGHPMEIGKKEVREE